jgi:hypothetical protein
MRKRKKEQADKIKKIIIGVIIAAAVGTLVVLALLGTPVVANPCIDNCNWQNHDTGRLCHCHGRCDTQGCICHLTCGVPQ